MLCFARLLEFFGTFEATSMAASVESIARALHNTGELLLLLLLLVFSSIAEPRSAQHTKARRGLWHAASSYAAGSEN
jgi:hypothetical protein